jgi:hypothetical protein
MTTHSPAVNAGYPNLSLPLRMLYRQGWQRRGVQRWSAADSEMFYRIHVD